MTAERPDISIDAVYSQAEAARLLKVDRHTLRRWEKVDPNLPGKREAINTKNGYLKPNPGRVRLSSRFP